VVRELIAVRPQLLWALLLTPALGACERSPDANAGPFAAVERVANNEDVSRMIGTCEPLQGSELSRSEESTRGPLSPAVRSYIEAVQRASSGRLAGFGWRPGDSDRPSPTLVLYLKGNELASLPQTNPGVPVDVVLGATSSAEEVYARVNAAHSLFREVLRTPFSPSYHPELEALIVTIHVPQPEERARILAECQTLSAAVRAPLKVKFEQYPLPRPR
jgi:hypothetical protein